MNTLIKRKKVDEKFIEFVVNLCGLTREVEVTIDKKWKNSHYKQIKRWCQKAFGSTWKEVWKVLHKDMKEILRTSKETYRYDHPLYFITAREKLLKDKKTGRPRAIEFFIATVILKGYFTWKLGSPHWNLIASALQPYSAAQLKAKGDYGEKYIPLQSWWQHMKKYLEKYKIKIDEMKYARMIYEQYQHSRGRMHTM